MSTGTVDFPGLRDLVLGVVGGAMLIGALGLLLFGGPADGSTGESVAPPALTLEDPTSGDDVSLPLVLRFRSAAPLAARPGGWGTETLHLHAEIDGREVMPASGDIRRIEDGAYLWTVAGVGEGVRSIRLRWSDARHNPIVGGESDSVVVEASDG